MGSSAHTIPCMQGSGSTGPGAGTTNGSGHRYGSAHRYDAGDGHDAGRADEPPPGLRARLRRGLARLLVHWADAAARGVMRLLGESAASGRAHLSAAELRDLVAASTVLDGEGRRLIDEVLAAGGRHVREL